MATSKPGEQVSCNECGFVFPQDPCYQKSCPTCLANPNTYCKRPSGHSGPFVPFHSERDIAAFLAGHYDHLHPELNTPCGASSTNQADRERIASKSPKTKLMEEK